MDDTGNKETLIKNLVNPNLGTRIKEGLRRIKKRERCAICEICVGKGYESTEFYQLGLKKVCKNCFEENTATKIYK